jgi:tyrosyl-tRNA synthetase
VTVGPELLDGGNVWVVALLVHADLAQTNSEARRAIAQGGIRIDGDVVGDQRLQVKVADGMLLQHGKRRFARLKLISDRNG